MERQRKKDKDYRKSGARDLWHTCSAGWSHGFQDAWLQNPYAHVQANPYSHLHRDPYTHRKLPPPSPNLRETYNLLPSEHLKFDTVHDNPIMEEKGLDDQARFWRRKHNMKNHIASLEEGDSEEESSASWRRLHMMRTVGIPDDSQVKNSQASIPLWRRIHQLDEPVGGETH